MSLRHGFLSEIALRVAYGLAADGHALRNGLPRNPLHSALLLAWGDGRLPGAHAMLEPIFKLRARVALEEPWPPPAPGRAHAPS